MSRLERRALLAIVLLAILVRVIAFVQGSSTPLLSSYRWNQSDMGFFHAMAERVADGDLLLDGTFHPSGHHWRDTIAREHLQRHPEDADPSLTDEEQGRQLWDRWLGPGIYYQEPFYTYALSVALRLPGRDARWMIVFQLLLGVATIVLLAAVTRRVFGEGPAIAAAALALLYAPFVFYELVLLRASLLVFATVAIGLVFLEAIERDRPSAWLVAGLLTGFAMLLKSVFAPFALVALLHVLLRHRRDPKVALLSAAALGGGVLLGLLPVVVRNLTVGAPPFALASPGLANLIFGLGPAVEPRAGDSTYDFASYGEIMSRTGGAILPSLVEMLRLHGGVGSFLEVLGKKFLHLWYWYEIPNNVNFNYFESRIGVLRFLPLRFLALAPLGLAGLALARRTLLRRWPLALAVLTAVAVLTVFANNSRTRLPLAVALVPFAALTLVRLLEWVRARRWRPLEATVVAVAVLALAMSGAHPRDRTRPADHLLALEAHYLPSADRAEIAGDPGAAADVLREAVRQGPAWVRDPSGWRDPTPQDRALAGLYGNALLRCADLLRRAGRPAEAATYQDLARRLHAALQGSAPTPSER